MSSSLQTRLLAVLSSEIARRARSMTASRLLEECARLEFGGELRPYLRDLLLAEVSRKAKEMSLTALCREVGRLRLDTERSAPQRTSFGVVRGPNAPSRKRYRVNRLSWRESGRETPRVERGRVSTPTSARVYGFSSTGQAKSCDHSRSRFWGSVAFARRFRAVEIPDVRFAPAIPKERFSAWLRDSCGLPPFDTDFPIKENGDDAWSAVLVFSDTDTAVNALRTLKCKAKWLHPKPYYGDIRSRAELDQDLKDYMKCRVRDIRFGNSLTNVNTEFSLY